MDGLLIDSEPMWTEAARSVMQKVNFEITDAIRIQSTGLSIKLFLDLCHQIQPWNTPSFEELEAEILGKAHHDILAHAEAMPGAITLITELKKQGLKLAVA